MSNYQNKWKLPEELREKYRPIIQEVLTKWENMTYDEVEVAKNEDFTIDLSNTGLTPYTLLELMKEFGYTDETFNDNGWQLDYWITIRKPKTDYPSTCQTLKINGTGIIFDLNLTVAEFL